jgi:hypothetical protein
MSPTGSPPLQNGVPCSGMVLRGLTEGEGSRASRPLWGLTPAFLTVYEYYNLLALHGTGWYHCCYSTHWLPCYYAVNLLGASAKSHGFLSLQCYITILVLGGVGN